MTGLTPMQSKALAFIRDFIAEKGWSPSFDEIGAALDIKSKSGIHRIVTGLRDRSAIMFTPKCRRSICVLEPARVATDLGFLDPHLETWVRVVAARAGRTPHQVINECVRDGYANTTGRNPEHNVRCETSGRQPGGNLSHRPGPDAGTAGQGVASHA